MKKNVASQIIGAEMLDASTGAAFAGTVTCYVTGDNGTQAIGSVGSGVCTSKGNGLFNYAPAQAETNYDFIQFTFVGTGAVAQTVELYTDFPQTGDSFARIGSPTGASIAADIQTRSTFASGGSVNATQWGGVNVTGMPMPTYTQPTGFLAATFPTTVSSFASGGSVNATQIGGVSASVSGSSVSFPTSVASANGVNVTQLAGSTVAVSGGTTTFPSTIASPTNITAGTITTVSGNVAGSVGSVTGAVTLSATQGAITFASLTSTGAFTVNGYSLNVNDINSLAGAFDSGSRNLTVNIEGNIIGDVQGKVLGGGVSAFTGVGVQTASTGSGLSGPSPVTITFVDANGDPVPLVEFSVVGQGVDRADTNGVANFGLNDGSYTIVAGPVGGVMFANTSLTVLGSGAATIVGYTVAITPPSDPTLCVVYGFAVKNDGSKAANVTITFIVATNIPSKTAAGSIIAYIPVNVTSDANGFFQATLIRDKAYQINSPTLRFNGTVFTPTGSSYDLSTAIT